MIRPTTLPLIVATTLLATAASAADVHMIHKTRGNHAVGVFTPDGPKLATMQKAPRRLDFITFDASTGTYFGQQTSTLGVLENGKLTPVETPESVDLSHAGGLTFDAERGCVLVASRSGAGTVLFEYAPGANAWTEIGNIGRDDFHGLACDGAGLIYALDKPAHAQACTNLRVFNRTGAQVAAIDLSTPIPFYSSLRPHLQLAYGGDALYALVTNDETHPRVTDAIYAIDPANGNVDQTPYNASVDLIEQTWPSWPKGPAPSTAMAAAGAAGRGAYSNYETPAALVKRQASELHVVAVGSGETNYLEWLKKVKKVGASSTKDGMAISVELDLDAEMNHPVVEVVVGKTDGPITLALVAESTVVWSISAAPNANIAKVITYGAPFFSTSTVIGVDPALVADGGSVSVAYAWEMANGSGRHFDEMIETIREQQGLRENSFQGLVRGTTFTVPSAAGAQHASVDDAP